jgi:methionyl-tRNA formyltransferase
VRNSFLENELIKRGIHFLPIKNKEWLISRIKECNFDFLVSNGCPYILPISGLQKPGQVFINIHPSLLPDLKGNNSINGAILFNRDAGATCHIMDDGTDTGAIISQIKIPLSHDLDIGLLYQVTFEAEGEVFDKALEKNFAPAKKNPQLKECIYYTRKEEDLKLDFAGDVGTIIRKIKAFGIKSLGAYFVHKGHKYKVYDCDTIQNKYLNTRLGNYSELEIVYKYESNIVVKKSNMFLKLKAIEGNINLLQAGETL